MRFARIVFLIAGIYGIVVIAPQYGMEDVIARASTPITHPEHFYGFLGLCIAWQIMFILISRAPDRFRPAMLVAIVEKLVFVVPVYLLYARGRVNSQVVGFASIDLIWAVLFTISYLRTPSASVTPNASARRAA
jgi:uncharacterized membrane protein YuzA (DUF378 family)